jgi:hypothetical protein
LERKQPKNAKNTKLSVIYLARSEITETSPTKKKRWKENNPKTPPKIIEPGLLRTFATSTEYPNIIAYLV